MPGLLSNVVIYILAFVLIWAGSGFVVSSVAKLSQKLRVSSFLISFLILGLLTSTPEAAVGFTAVLSNSPGIFVGNLLGGVPVLFLFVIPILAIAGRGIKLSSDLSEKSILISFIICFAPLLAVFDKQITNSEGLALIVVYAAGVFFLERESGVSSRTLSTLRFKSYSLLDIVKILIGTAVVLFASHIIVDKTIYFSEVFHIAPFYISLLVLSLGTNLPEITLAFRSIVSNKKDIAIGDYLGSASANTFLLGVFTLMSEGSTIAVDNFLVMFVLVNFGLLLFYKFARSKHTISAKEGVLLLIVYIVFVLLEIIQKK